MWSAGRELIKPTRLISEEDISQTFGTITNGLLGASKIFCSKNFWPSSGGSLLLVSSVSAMRSNHGMAVYSGAKAALSGIMKSLSVELSSRNVRVNCILLGAIKTEMHQRIIKYLNEDSLIEYEQKHLLGFGELEDINPMIIHMLSDASSWMTGSNIVLDGGFNAK